MLKSKTSIFLLIIIFALTLFSCKRTEKRVYPDGEINFKIIETTDIHGSIFPYNFITAKDEKTSMANIYTYVKELRDKGETILLVDDGDSLQGQPTVYYYNFVETNKTHLWADILNYMQYDAISVGNHDIEAGHNVYDKIKNEFEAPLICANLTDEKTKKPYFKPYTIVKKEGIKIAILGMVEPAIDRQLPKVLYSGIIVEDMIETAKKWVKIIEEKEKPDLLIGLFHAGADYTSDNVEYKNENASQLVAEQVEGFDLILVGHDHQGWSGLGYDEETKQKTKVVKSPSGKIIPIFGGVNNARYIASIDVSMIYDKESKTWKKSFNGELIDPSQFEANKEFLDKFNDARKQIENWVNVDIATLNTKLTSDEAMFGDSYFLSLLHKYQIEIAKKVLGEDIDVSVAAPLSQSATLNVGTIRVRDMFALYPYENFFYVMKLTGQQIKDAMEYSYGKWFNQMTDINDDLIAFKKDDNGDIIFNKRYNSYATITPSYNYDSYAGINYIVDVTKPFGAKVKIESFSDGREFELNKEYKVAINSYRASGGGGHLTDGSKIDLKTLQNNELVIKATDKDLRYYIMELLKEQKEPIVVKKIGNWKIIPEDYVEAGKKKDYKLLYPNN